MLVGETIHLRPGIVKTDSVKIGCRASGGY